MRTNWTPIGLRVTPQELFGKNYPRLVELKAKYDPTNMFNAYDLTGSAK
jgi:FAD/FMN-containing dehydrogenase